MTRRPSGMIYPVPCFCGRWYSHFFFPEACPCGRPIVFAPLHTLLCFADDELIAHGPAARAAFEQGRHFEPYRRWRLALSTQELTQQSTGSGPLADHLPPFGQGALAA